MGFMAGFGPAFSRSFESGVENRRQKDQDAYRFAMQDLINRRDKELEYKREDRKAANKAQGLLEGSAAPAEAFEVVYDWVKSDISDTEIAKRLATGKWNIKKAVEGPDKAADVGGIDQQMAASGLSVGEPEPAPTAAPAAPAPEQGGILSNILGMKPRQDRQTRALGDAAKTLNMDPAEANRLVSGQGGAGNSIKRTGNVEFIPGAPEREPDPFAANTNQAMFELKSAEAEAAQLGQMTPRLKEAQMRVHAIREAQIFDNSLENGPGGVAASIWDGEQYKTTTQVTMQPDGSFLDADGRTTYTPDQVRIVTDDQKKLVSDINQSLEKDSRDLRNMENDFTGTVRSVAIMSDIIRKTNGAVLAPRAPYIFKKGQEWLKDMSVTANELTRLFTETKPGEIVATREQYNQLLAAEARALREDPADIGAQIGLFDIQKAIFAYRLAASMGQEGRSLAETERKMFTEMAVSGITPDRFYQGMSDLLVPAARQIDDTGKAIYEGNDYLKQHLDDYGYIPERYSHKPISDKLSETTDPELKEIWQQLGFFTRGQSEGTPAPTEAPQPAPNQNIPRINSKAEYDALPAGTRYIGPDGEPRTKTGGQ